MLGSLQAGRALAALSVLAFHLSIMFREPRFGMQPILADYTSHGWLGVNFFFVLSGFIILLAHRRDIGQPRRGDDYLIKRFIRLYPVYWLITAVAVAGTLAFGGTKGLPVSLPDFATTMSLIHMNDFRAPIGPAWTLYHEILFYAFFLSLILHRHIGMMLMGLWVVIIAVFNLQDMTTESRFWSTFVAPSNLNFFLGMIAFGMMRKAPSRAVGGWILAAGLITIPIIYGWERTLNLVPDTVSPPLVQLAYSISFMLIIAGAAAIEKHGMILAAPLLSLIGDASYMLYLAHESVASMMLKLLKAAGLLNIIPHVPLYLGIYVVTVVACVIGYLLVEAPLLRKLRALLVRPRTATPPLQDQKTARSNA